jgi:hypothetical protein
LQRGVHVGRLRFELRELGPRRLDVAAELLQLTLGVEQVLGSLVRAILHGLDLASRLRRGFGAVVG